MNQSNYALLTALYDSQASDFYKGKNNKKN